MFYFDFFHVDRHINNKKKTNRKTFHVRYNNSQGMQKMTKTRNGKHQIFQKLFQWPLMISFGF